MKQQQRPVNYLFSVALHLFFFAAFIFMPQKPEELQKEELVEVGFGIGSGSGFGGGMGMDMQEPGGAPVEEEKLTEEKTTEKSVKTESAGDNEETIASKAKITAKSESKGGDGTGTGTGIGAGSGSGFGYDIDWGGGGRRRIYSYNVPEYPSGANKELDIKIRFTILPDGSVGKIFLLAKGDTRLENSAISSLRQWRFEPLRSQQPQIEQTAVIVFPFRLQ